MPDNPFNNKNDGSASAKWETSQDPVLSTVQLEIVASSLDTQDGAEATVASTLECYVSTNATDDWVTYYNYTWTSPTMGVSFKKTENSESNTDTISLIDYSLSSEDVITCLVEVYSNTGADIEYAGDAVSYILSEDYGGLSNEKISSAEVTTYTQTDSTSYSMTDEQKNTSTSNWVSGYSAPGNIFFSVVQGFYSDIIGETVDLDS